MGIEQMRAHIAESREVYLPHAVRWNGIEIRPGIETQIDGAHVHIVYVEQQAAVGPLSQLGKELCLGNRRSIPTQIRGGIFEQDLATQDVLNRANALRYVFQTLKPIAVPLPFAGSNQVCVLELTEQTSGPAGTTYQVVDADCEDANELECSVSCPNSIGWTVTIPGGTELIGGQ